MYMNGLCYHPWPPTLNPIKNAQTEIDGGAHNLIFIYLHNDNISRLGGYTNELLLYYYVDRFQLAKKDSTAVDGNTVELGSG